MQEFSHPLGDAIKTARKKMKLTQNEVAAMADLDPRTILNIENYKGNPKMEVLYPLVRCLKIDPAEIFYPEEAQPNCELKRLQFLIKDCTEAEALLLANIISAILQVMRASDNSATVPASIETIFNP